MKLMFSLFFFLLISDQSVLLLLFFHHPELILTHSVFFIALSDLHDLLSLALRLLNLLPCLLLLHFQESDSVCEKFSIVGCLLFVDAGFFQCTCDFIFFSFLSILLIVTFLTFIVLLLTIILFIVLLKLLLSLRHRLRLFRGLNFFLLLLVTVH